MHRSLGPDFSPRRNRLTLPLARKLALNLAVALTLFLAPLALSAGELCQKFFATLPGIRPESVQMAHALEDFAKENNLSMRVLEVGPPERRVNRMFVAIDMNDQAMMKKFRDRFQLDPNTNTPYDPAKYKPGGPRAPANRDPNNHGPDGVIAFENDFPTPTNAHYVSIGFRPNGGGMDQKIWRWGRPDETLQSWTTMYGMSPGANRAGMGKEADFVAWSHLIGINEDEKATVKDFLTVSDVKAKNPRVLPPKTQNCMNWMCGIQYDGKVEAGVPKEDRKLLFNDLLQMSATIDPREWVLRASKASGENHTSMVIFVNGQKGLDHFNAPDALKDFLPGEPKIPYSQIVKGVDFEYAPESDIMNAMKQIPDGGRVFMPIAAGASPEGTAALTQYAKSLKDGLNVHMLVNGVPGGAVEKALAVAKVDGQPALKIDALFVGPNLRAAVAQGKVGVKDDHLSVLAEKINNAEEGYKYDAIVVRVSTPDAAGHYSLGTNNDMILDVIQKNPGIKVIAEVNPNVPKTIGKNYLEAKDITAQFKSNTNLAGPPVPPYEEAIEGNIGKNLATLIDDGATLQIGIGNAFAGLPKAMNQKRVAAAQPGQAWQGVHMFSEMVGDTAMDMAKSGVVKDIKAGFGFGTEDFYKWTNNNQKVEFVPTRVVNDRAAIAAQPKMTAVNTALQVDLAGNANATVGPGGRKISSVGGQLDFMQGAANAPDGKSVMVIRSRIKGKDESTIVLDTYNNNVTTPGSAVSHLVTEYGVANIKGVSQDVRAARIINIAHPDDRQKLFEEAKAKGYFKDDGISYANGVISGPGV